MKKAASEQTAQYIKDKMPRAIGFYNENAILDYAVHSAIVPGCYLEFGVFKGRSLRRIAKEAGSLQKIHGFDSFEGLPESWTSATLKGAFSVHGRLPKVPANVILHQGLFSETLPAWLVDYADVVSFVHIDCDLYSSTKNIFDLLWPRIQCGSILLFDEYFNYPNWHAHEFRAFQEFVAERKIEYDYIAYSWAQVVVKITKIRPS